MDRYKLGDNAWITTSTEHIVTEGDGVINGSILYADNKAIMTVKTERVVCLRVATTTEEAIAITMDTKQAKAVRKALKMQIKAIKDEQKHRRAKQ